MAHLSAIQRWFRHNGKNETTSIKAAFRMDDVTFHGNVGGGFNIFIYIYFFSFIFTPIFGEMIQFDYNTFQMGWVEKPATTKCGGELVREIDSKQKLGLKIRLVNYYHRHKNTRLPRFDLWTPQKTHRRSSKPQVGMEGSPRGKCRSRPEIFVHFSWIPFRNS